MSRKRRPRDWFYLHVANREMFRLFDPAAVGRGLIDAMNYFISGELPQFEDESAAFQEILVFTALRAGVDESIADYNAAVEGGKLGPAAKRAKATEQEAEPP